jgi:hypothetical protein
VRWDRSWLVVALVLGVTQTACGSADDTAEPGGGGGGGSKFPAVSDFAAPGPFTTTSAAEGPACTIFRPEPLGEAGRKHPIIIWGNGTGANPQVYAGVLTHWASHGFIVAAANTSNAGSGTEMLACLDYVLQQDGVSGSAYSGNVAGDRVGASGHSQGGGGTLMVGRDQRITATAPLQPFIQFGFGGVDAASAAQQKGPMFLMSGSNDTIAAPAANQQPVFDTTNVPTFWGTLQGADHIASAIGTISDYRGPATAWFRLHLMADESARSLFYGTSCGLCSNPAWVVQRKGI